MPKEPILIYPQLAEPVLVPTAPSAPITLDKWDSQELFRFTRQQFTGLLSGQRVPGFVEAPFVPDLSTWQSIRTQVFTRRFFLIHETHELPRLPTPPVVPDLSTWQSTTTPPVFAKRVFLLHETHEIPRIPSLPESITLDKWLSSRTAEPFPRRRFFPGITVHSPSTIFAEPIRVDKWEPRTGVIFNQRRFLRGPGGQTLLDLITPPPITTPLIIFMGLSSLAALVSTQDVISWAGVGQVTAGTSPSRSMICDGLSQHAALVAAIDLMTWAGSSNVAALDSHARGGG